MSVIIIPRRHYTQPQGRVAVADFNIRCAFLAASEVELTSMNPVVQRNTSHRYMVGCDSEGPCVLQGGAARYASGVRIDSGGSSRITRGSYVVWSGIFYQNSTNTNYKTLCGNRITALSASNAGTFQLNADAFTREISVEINDTTQILQINSGLFAPLNQWVTVCVRITEDGFIFNTSFGTSLVGVVPTANPNMITVTALGLGSSSIDFSGYIGNAHYMVAVGDGDLPEDLVINPWQLFRADPIRIYSLPSGPIGVSWSSLTASGITPTTATLTLGGITR